MEWPLFTQKYEAVISPGKPAYWDLLVILLVVLAGIVGFLVTRLGQKGTAHTLQLITLRPGHIVTLREYRVPVSQYLFGSLFAGTQIGLLLLLLLTSSGAISAGAELFWLYFFRLSGAVLGLFVIHFVFMAWVGYTFAERSEASLWLTNVVILFILFGTSLLVPILFLAMVPGGVSFWWAFGLSATLYVSYWVWFVVRGLSVLSKFRRAPLLIILYLCACETAPLYLTFSLFPTL